MLAGVKNFVMNIKPIMEKLRDGQAITKEEGKTVTEFYLEVCYFCGQLS